MTIMQIGESAFANTGFEELAIKLGSDKKSPIVAWIEPYAFANCRNLRSISTVLNTYISDHEFAYCTSLSSIYIENRHSFFFDNAFEGCTSLKDVKIPA